MDWEDLLSDMREGRDAVREERLVWERNCMAEEDPYEQDGPCVRWAEVVPLSNGDLSGDEIEVVLSSPLEDGDLSGDEIELVSVDGGSVDGIEARGRALARHNRQGGVFLAAIADLMEQRGRRQLGGGRQR